MAQQMTLGHDALKTIVTNVMGLAGPKGLDTHSKCEQDVPGSLARDLIAAGRGGLDTLHLLRLHGDARFYVRDVLRRDGDAQALELAIQEMLHEGLIAFCVDPEGRYITELDDTKLYAYTVYPVQQA